MALSLVNAKSTSSRKDGILTVEGNYILNPNHHDPLIPNNDSNRGQFYEKLQKW